MYLESVQQQKSQYFAFLDRFKDPVRYTQQQKKRDNLLLLNWLKIKYVELKKYMLHIKLTYSIQLVVHVIYIPLIKGPCLCIKHISELSILMFREFGPVI